MYEFKEKFEGRMFDTIQIDYDRLKITPDYDITNYSNLNIVNVFNNLYKTPRQRLDIRARKFEFLPKIMHETIIEKGKSDFYIIVPKTYSKLISTKLNNVWCNASIKSVKDDILINNNNTDVCEMILKDYNFKSLSTDLTNQYPLHSIIGLSSSMKDNEQIRIITCIEPMSRMNWINKSKDEIKQYKEGRIKDNTQSQSEKLMKLGFNGLEAALNIYIDYKLLLLESIIGIINTTDEKPEQTINIKIDSLEANKERLKYSELGSYTKYKMNSEVFKCRLFILSSSDDSLRRQFNLLTIANSYKEINYDNELTAKLYNQNEQLTVLKFLQARDINMMKAPVFSDKEVAKLIQLPQKTLQEQYVIDRIDTREIDIPNQLQNGKVSIGIAEKQRRAIKTTWSTDINIMALAKVWVGCQNSGKTTAIKRTVKECHDAGYSNIVIDYIENCGTALEIAENIPDKDKIFIMLGEKGMPSALAYNEVSGQITEDMDPWDRVRLANLISEQVEYLIDSINDNSTGELTSPMLRYLHSACMATFIRPGAKLQDVFTVLRRWQVRNEAIRYARYSGCFTEDDDIFYDLDELHQRDSTGRIIGTRENLIVGILNRIILLNKNPDVKAMLQSDINYEQNFTKYVEEGKSVFIMIPQHKFPNPVVRDILTTYYITRIWLAVQMRDNNKDSRLCNVVFDEVHQVPTTAKFLSNHITEFRRHRLGLMITCHYLKQLRDLLGALKSSGASYVLIAGTEKENLELLREEIAPFTIEDGLKLKPYHSLNIINYGNQYARFVTKLEK